MWTGIMLLAPSRGACVLDLGMCLCKREQTRQQQRHCRVHTDLRPGWDGLNGMTSRLASIISLLWTADVSHVPRRFASHNEPASGATDSLCLTCSSRGSSNTVPPTEVQARPAKLTTGCPACQKTTRWTGKTRCAKPRGVLHATSHPLPEGGGRLPRARASEC